MIFLKQELFERLDTIEGLRASLQTALELEHATIPPYLTAAFSLHGTVNAWIASTILDVAVEEMLHMTLVCNLINAIGGAPQLKHPEFVPKYPCPLPGSIDDDLVVGLRAYSPELVGRTFLRIEEPEDPLVFERMMVAEQERRTIGQFYLAIKARLQAFGPSVFTGDPARQIIKAVGDDTSIAVTNMDSALAAIDQIVQQGEGTQQSPVSGNGELAHFYRFQQLAKGLKLVREGDTFVFRDPIAFDAAAVYPMKPDLRSGDLPEGSGGRRAVDSFNLTYTKMLSRLHEAFNGQPARLSGAISLMFELTDLATTALQIPIGGAYHAGPTFEFLPDSIAREKADRS